MLILSQYTGLNVGGRPYVTNGLMLYLDAQRSYPGTGQTWFDISGGSRNFYLGSGSGSGADDPTWNAGPPAYFSTDGGDFFTPAYTTTGDFLRTVGRSDVSFTIEMFWYFVAPGGSNYYNFSNMNNLAAGNGCALFQGGPTNDLRLTATSIAVAAGPSISSSGWAQYALTARLNNSAPCQWYKNGATSGSSFTFDNTGWAAGDSVDNPNIFSTSGSFPAYVGTRTGILRIYNRILTAGEILQNYNADKARFGL